jgi:hypothetical protein
MFASTVAKLNNFEEANNFDDDVVAEWVGLHYKVNFDACNEVGKDRWRNRYEDMHSEEK